MSTPSRKRFGQRVALVTGASSGFGLATARAFAAEGATVVLSARNTQRLQQAVSELQAEGLTGIHGEPCDVSKREQVDALVSKSVGKFGRIDILVNNVGA